MKTLELKGFKSLRALNVFHSLILGLLMLPAYRGVQYEEFLARVDEMPDDQKEKIIREAALFVALDEEEVKSVVGFCCDPNGVPYDAANLKSMTPDQIFEMIVAVSMQVAKIKISLVSEAEKKSLEIAPLM